MNDKEQKQTFEEYFPQWKITKKSPKCFFAVNRRMSKKNLKQFDETLLCNL